MTLRDRVPPDSWAGLQAWIMSTLFHTLLLTLIFSFLQHMPRTTHEPFHWTISLVQPSDVPSDDAAEPSAHAEHPMAALTSESQSFVPARPSTTVVERPIPSKSHAVARPQHSATVALNRHSPPMLTPELRPHTVPPEITAQHHEPSEALAESARPQEIATDQLTQASEPMLHPPSHSSDQPVGTSSLATAAPSEAEAPAAPPVLATDALPVAAAPAVPLTRNEDAPPPMMASRLPAVDHGSSLTAGEPGSIQKDEARPEQAFQDHSSQMRSPSDYGWLQQALSRRLEELKRSVRPSMEESGHLRVLVKAVVSSTGELMEAEIVKSSGHHGIDREAMTLVQRAFPMLLDRDLDRPQIVMRIPITFSHN